MQTIANSYTQLPSLCQELGIRRPLLIHGSSFAKSPAMALLRSHFPDLIRFDGFSPNPDSRELALALACFQKNDCDGLIAAGGGSAIDVAKGVKYFGECDPSQDLFGQKPKGARVPLVAIPTTAGTGSEATHFAVIYHQGLKQSLAHESLRPQAAVLDAGFLYTLPVYVKKCTVLDAMAQAVESYWSVRATDQSRAFAQRALQELMPHVEAYLQGDTQAAAHVMLGAHLAGEAINLSTTTAAHAMSYQLTKKFALPHGHAVALCLAKVWRRMLQEPRDCLLTGGIPELELRFSRLAALLGAATPQEAADQWERRLERWQMAQPQSLRREDDLEELSASVNTQRLGNNPVRLSREDLRGLYERILL